MILVFFKVSAFVINLLLSIVKMILVPLRKIHNYFTFKTNSLYNQKLFGNNFNPKTELEKKATVSETAKKFSASTFIETGTYYGDMIESQLDVFELIHSIELMPPLAKKADDKFKKMEHVHVHQGNSGWILESLLEEIKSPCLFWLDAHFQTDVGKKFGDLIDAPVKDEFLAIINSKLEKYVIMIDDARFFTGVRNYPTIKWLQSELEKRNLHFEVKVVDDIIYVLPREQLNN